MEPDLLLTFLIAFTALVIGAYMLGAGKAKAIAAGGTRLHSLPGYHGLYSAASVAVPMLLIGIVGANVTGYLAAERGLASLPAEMQPADSFARNAVINSIRIAATDPSVNAASLGPNPEERRAAGGVYRQTRDIGGWLTLIAAIIAAAGAFAVARGKLDAPFRARNRFELFILWLLIGASAIAILTTVGIVFSVLFETFRFFTMVSPVDFLFGTSWSPIIDPVDGPKFFGAIPLFVGAIIITLIAIVVAGPVGLFAAIYLSEYASPRLRALAKPVLEVLAGIPTVVFGFFAALTVAPFIKGLAQSIGLPADADNALAAGIVMGVMIIPFISSLSDDVITAVPQALRDGSYAMGATQSETIRRVVLPAALPGIVSAFMLAISRAIGETMIVVMAAGLSGAVLKFSPLEGLTTVTVQIKKMLAGDQEFDSAKTLSAFALGFLLFVFTLALNLIAQRIVAKYREQYD
jgi:phosphate transport system permease protein